MLQTLTADPCYRFLLQLTDRRVVAIPRSHPAFPSHISRRLRSAESDWKRMGSPGRSPERSPDLAPLPPPNPAWLEEGRSGDMGARFRVAVVDPITLHGEIELESEIRRELASGELRHVPIWELKKFEDAERSEFKVRGREPLKTPASRPPLQTLASSGTLR